MDHSRTRSVLSVISVALGVGMILATDRIGASLLGVFQESDLSQALGLGVFEQFTYLIDMVGIGVLVAGGFLIYNAFVMGINQRGLHFDTPDARPIQCIVLLATPQGERDRHLEVLATLARTLGVDSVVQQQLFNAKSPAHAYEILHGEEADDFNYFLETDTD